MSASHNRRVFGVVACAATIALGAVGVSLAAPRTAATGADRNALDALERPSSSPVASVDADQASAFALLRRPADVAPVQVRQDIQRAPFYRAFGLNIELARSALTPASAIPVWVIPGDGFLCIWLKDPVDGAAVSCDSTATVLKNGLIVSLVTPGKPEITVAGMLPDSARGLRVDDAQGRAIGVDDSGMFGVASVSGSALHFDTNSGDRAVALARPTTTDIFGQTRSG
jgi:hypothetical protein